MKLADYFRRAEGVGVLATADAEGRVDTAIYEKPEIIDDGTVAFNMLAKTSYANLRQNPYASYMFIELSMEWKGQRIYLEKIEEKDGLQRVAELRAAGRPVADPAQSSKHYVVFKVTRIRPLVGDVQLGTS